VICSSHSTTHGTGNPPVLLVPPAFLQYGCRRQMDDISLFHLYQMPFDYWMPKRVRFSAYQPNKLPIHLADQQRSGGQMDTPCPDISIKPPCHQTRSTPPSRQDSPDDQRYLPASLGSNQQDMSSAVSRLRFHGSTPPLAAATAPLPHHLALPILPVDLHINGVAVRSALCRTTPLATL
jgi:hypothetical protein